MGLQENYISSPKEIERGIMFNLKVSQDHQQGWIPLLDTSFRTREEIESSMKDFYRLFARFDK